MSVTTVAARRKDCEPNMITRWIRLIAGTIMGAVLAGCAVLAPLPPREDVSARLKAVPTKGAPLEGVVTIHWNDNQVPFIEAASDDDLAVALGIVHAHLRLGQMEIARRISQKIESHARTSRVALNHAFSA